MSKPENNLPIDNFITITSRFVSSFHRYFTNVVKRTEPCPQTSEVINLGFLFRQAGYSVQSEPGSTLHAVLPTKYRIEGALMCLEVTLRGSELSVMFAGKQVPIEKVGTFLIFV